MTPTLRIVRGDPSAEELAALTALVVASGGGDEPKPAPRRGGWNDPAHSLRRGLVSGPNGWRASQI